MELSDYHPFVSAEAKAEYSRMYDKKAKQWPVPYEVRMVDTSYGKTFVRISGPINGEPLVLLHPTRDDSLFWIPNARALAGQFKIFAVDTIGECNCSIYTQDLPDISAYVSWLDELLTGLNLGAGINMMGLSYGGMLVSQYALRHPERLGGIVLVAPAATVLPLRPEFTLRALLCALRARYFASSFFFWLCEDYLLQDPSNRQIMEAYVSEKLLGVRCFKISRHIPSPVLTDEQLRSIRVPALFVVGEHEKMYSAGRAVERLNRLAPQIQARIVPGAGHDINKAQPETVSRLALEFLIAKYRQHGKPLIS
ncbi:MAG TPA: alpha/beta hydrolase [Methanocella sp.]|nr:alpha/beta hydrolase [Methanocella sp.]